MAVEFPGDVKELKRHASLYTAVKLVSAQQKPATETEVLASRCHTRHLLADGMILEVKPPMQTPFALKKNDFVKCRIVRELEDVMHVAGTVGWVRPKVFLPDGVAVSCIGVDFELVGADVARALARFIERIEPPKHVVTFASLDVMAKEYEQNLKVGGIFVPGSDAPAALTRTRVRLALPSGALQPGQPHHIDVEVDVVFAGPTGWGGQLVAPLSESQRTTLSCKRSGASAAPPPSSPEPQATEPEPQATEPESQTIEPETIEPETIEPETPEPESRED